MAIEMRTVIQGASPEQMQALIAQVGDKMKTFPGFIAHASGPIEGGFHVTELWESQEVHERWVREVVAPAMQQMGGGQVPPVQYLPADSVITR